MQAGAGTLSQPLEPAWALAVWSPPPLAISTLGGAPQSSALARIWKFGRTTFGSWLRTWIEKIGVIEVLQLVAAAERFQSSMLQYAKQSYDRADLDLLVLDPDISMQHQAVSRAALGVLQKHRSWLKPRASNLFPKEVLGDRSVKVRVEQAMKNLDEINDILRVASQVNELAQSDLNRSLKMPVEALPANPCWWAYDSRIPVEISERLLAGRRSSFLPSLLQISQDNWDSDSKRRAVRDWANDVEDFSGLFASIPGVVMKTVAAERKFDLLVVLEQHRQEMHERAAHFERSVAELGRN